MAEPSYKAPPLEHMLEQMFGRTTAITSDTCVFCKKDATEFRDPLSRKEFTISGLCQDCQDEVFGTGDEDMELVEVEFDANADVID